MSTLLSIPENSVPLTRAEQPPSDAEHRDLEHNTAVPQSEDTVVLKNPCIHYNTYMQCLLLLLIIAMSVGLFFLPKYISKDELLMSFAGCSVIGSTCLFLFCISKSFPIPRATTISPTQ